ncbi:MAG TPA: TadE family protein [Herpetosiphonaceae bacterium]
MSRCRRSSDPGQSLVEFALIAPLLFALMFVLVELGIVFSTYIGLTNSAREAARAGVAYQYTASSSGTPSVATVDAGRSAVMNSAIMDTLNPIINVANVSGLNPTYSYDPTTPTNNNYRYGDKLTVTLSYPHALFFNLFNVGTITIQASSEMRLEPGGF